MPQPLAPVQLRRQQQFARYAWGLLVYMLLTIVWGVFVRASGSGDGCGAHWPMCGGNVGSGKHWIELGHRVTTEMLGLFVLAELVWAFRVFSRGHVVRKAVTATLFLLALEGWLGGQLVMLRLVAYSRNPARIPWHSAHLISTFCLVAAFACTAWFATERKLALRRQGPVLGLLVAGLLSTLVLSVTGAIAALGDTVYPATSHADVMVRAGLATASFLLRERPVHPYMAVVVAMLLCLVAGITAHLRPSNATRSCARAIWLLLTAQMAVGLLNVVLLAPIWMQLIHLLVADLLWIALVLLTVSAMAEGVPQVEMMHVPEAVLNGARATVKDYVALTKPRVISLLLFTTLAAMFIAASGWPTHQFLPGLWLLLATGTGLYAAAGSSNAINMVCERDLDVRMERTSTRPTVTEKIHPRTALWFAFVLELFSFGLLWFSSNLLAATLALAGLVVYVNVYTLLLKRRTWSNIVIGGAAGAFPPLVGWAAAAGHLTPLAGLLFVLIFVWTPVHFWALALLIKDDYAKAGVPMLPVVKGDKYTVSQIGLYAVLTVAASLAPLLLGVHWLYAIAAVVLNVVLVRGCLQLYRGVDKLRAASLFHYSMLYLALLFLAMAIDKSILI